MELVWLGHVDAHDKQLVGGKAAPLSRLATRYPVPPGFCLTTAAYDRWGTQSDAAVKALPPTLCADVSAAYATLAELCQHPSPGVAVRSSAVGEDGQLASFAGQFATYLNIGGVEAIAEAIVRCWASAQQAQVQAYRRQHGAVSEHVRLAVLVQQLVAADVSAVVFSANPITGNRGEVVINASWGLGESIVGGTVTPDTYTVAKSDLSSATRHIAQKQRMTILAADGTQEVAVPRRLQTQPTLTAAQAFELAQLALTLEEEMGWPVDLECAYQEDKLFLLQCRPITRGV